VTKRAPEVRYITSSDGVSIACWSVGEGPPIIISHNFSLSHAELEWEIPLLRGFYTALGAHHQVIRFDPRMGGVSDQTVPSLTLDAMCLDVDAVAAEFGYDVFSLMGVSVMGAVAIEYAATRPERVSALILCDPLIAVGDSLAGEVLRGSAALTEATSADYSTEVFASMWYGEDETDITKRITAAAYERVDAILPAVLSWDASARLDEVRAPTLVIAATSTVAGDPEHARRIAATLPDTRLVRLEGRHAPYYVDQMAAIDAITRHLGGSGFEPPLTGGVQAVVFTDIVGSTEHTNVVGDAVAREEARGIEVLIHEKAKANNGRLVKHLGDGSLLVFDSPTSAVAFAVDLQTEMRKTELALRVGLAVGEPIEEDEDLHGAVVNLAARIVAEAEPGQVLVSDAARQLLVGKPYTFEPVGSRYVKGFDDAIALYEVARRS